MHAATMTRYLPKTSLGPQAQAYRRGWAFSYERGIPVPSLQHSLSQAAWWNYPLCPVNDYCPRQRLLRRAVVPFEWCTHAATVTRCATLSFQLCLSRKMPRHSDRGHTLRHF